MLSNVQRRQPCIWCPNGGDENARNLCCRKAVIMLSRQKKDHIMWLPFPKKMEPKNRMKNLTTQRRIERNGVHSADTRGEINKAVLRDKE